MNLKNHLFLTTKQVARRLKTTPVKVLMLAATSSLKAVKRGERVFVSAAELERYLIARRAR